MSYRRSSRHPRTHQEQRWGEPHRDWVRSKRRPRRLPTSYSDIHPKAQRCWKEHRRTQYKTQAETAKAVGIASSAFSKILAGKRKMQPMSDGNVNHLKTIVELDGKPLVINHGTEQNRARYDRLTPAQKDALHRLVASHRTPEYRAQVQAVRAAIEREVEETGGITSTTGEFIPVIKPPRAMPPRAGLG